MRSPQHKPFSRRGTPAVLFASALALGTACSNGGTDSTDAGPGQGTGGGNSTGGATGSGGSPGSGGGSTGGSTGTGGGSGGTTATGGTTGTGGATATGGGSGGGAAGAGAGGTTGTGGAPATGGAGGGKGGAGGAGAAGGRAGAAGGGSGGSAGAAGGHAGGTGGGTGGGAGGSGGATSGSVPAGYPTPTTANRAICMSVAQTTSANGDLVCPGGGVGPACIECLFGGSTYTTTDVATSQGTSEAGNYAVTVQLGGSAAGQTEIHAEANRVLLGMTSTGAGQSATYAFAVNVRAKEGQPTENVAAGYPGLDLFFSGPTAAGLQIPDIGYALVSTATKPVMLYVAGDSTVCDQTDTDYAGWAEMIPQYFAPPIDVANYADSGESSASFLGSGAEWGTVKNLMAAGDWVFIQFGHNDKTTTSADFQANITQMVKDAKAKGATPVLFSPPARATFSGGTISDQSSLHGADMQAVATAQNVAFVDLTTITTTWYNGLGSNGWQQYHALGSDMTHTNAAGASKIAGFVQAALKSQNIGIAQYLR
jgi:lysophospholipase L1-like esterase